MKVINLNTKEVENKQVYTWEINKAKLRRCCCELATAEKRKIKTPKRSRPNACVTRIERKQKWRSKFTFYFLPCTFYLLPGLPFGVSYCARCAKYIVFTWTEKYSKDHFLCIILKSKHKRFTKKGWCAAIWAITTESQRKNNWRRIYLFRI